MRLSDLFFTNTNTVSAGSTQSVVTVDPYQQQRLNQELSRLKPGQTLQGEVIGKNGNEVQIRLNEDLVLTARLEKSIEMEPGRVMTFEVKNNGGGTLALSPLFENMGTDANVLKALDMAGLPANQVSVAMTEAMMQEGMSIDRNSLMNMYKQVTNFPEYQPASVVALEKLGIELTPENLQQLENYKNLEHQMIKDLASVLDELPFQYESMVRTGDGEGAAALYQAVLNLVAEGEEAIAAGLQEKLTSAQFPDAAGENGNLPAGSANSVDTLLKASEGTDVTQNLNIQNDTDGRMAQGELSAVNGGTEAVKEGVTAGEAAAAQNVSSEIQQNLDMTLMSIIGKDALENLIQQLKNVGAPESMQQAFADGSLTAKEALTEISKMLTQLPEESREVLSHRIFSDKGFQNLVKNALTEQWLLTPADVREKGKVDALYERLNSQLSRFSEAIAGKVNADNPLAKSVTNLQNNLDFMNQINQMYSYVQLPLKMTEGRANGDLYVYTNKRSLASKDGSVSALLHLDMEHLGPVDVYVAMKEQKVNTHFYLPDEEMLAFVEKHIYLLNERLEKKGYAMNTVVSVKNQEKEAVQEMLDNGKSMTGLSHYSFDVRA